MTAPRMTAAQRADRGPIPAVYGRSIPSTLATPLAEFDREHRPDPEWTTDRWTWEFRCAIVGPCLTGAHVTPEPEPEP